MIGLLASFFKSGVVNSIERVASEFIETDKESAEAKSLMVKTLDPNGLMRRELSRFASAAYGFYLVITVILIFCYFFGWTNDPKVAKEAITAITELFLPITSAWGGIVAASFGVNATNSIKQK